MNNNDDMRCILIVEDDALIAETLIFALEREAFKVDWQTTGEGALAHLQNEAIDLVLLDIGLPDMNGFDVLKAIRQTSEVPVIFTTARDDEIDKVLGLELGADDYVTKPLSPRELVARIKANLKRSMPIKTASSSVKPVLKTDFEINTKLMQINFKGQVLVLTKVEFNVLAYLVKHPQQVFSRDQLLTAAWDDHYSADSRTIDTHIKSLRAKLREHKADKDYIKTHRGLGYSMNL